MDAEFDSAENVKDRTKWWWLGVGLVFCVMLLALWQWSHLESRKSVAQVQHILVSYDAADPAAQARALDLLKEIRQRALDGESFSRLAETYSMDPGSAKRGGHLGYVERGELVDEIETYIWSAPIGQLSDVIKTKYGFHIVIVKDRRVSEAEKAVQAEQKRLVEELERRKKEREQEQGQ